jgi:type VI secretion system protein ImpG
MRDELLTYYERELVYLRQLGAEFAEKYPKIASRLLLEPDKCEDPHVERMIEAVAFLASRIHLKIDDDFPEITESLLNVLYPHYLAPIPSMSIVQFLVDPVQTRLSAGHEIPRHSALISRPIQGTPCRFRNSYDVTLWPLEIHAAVMEPPERIDPRNRNLGGVLRLSLRCFNDTKFSTLKIGQGEKGQPIERLRFYLDGDPQLLFSLYELLFSQCISVELRPVNFKPLPGKRAPDPIFLSPRALVPVGFGELEGLLPYPSRSFYGYRILSEYFAFPEKFMFFEITGLDQAARAGFGDQMDILITLRDRAAAKLTVDADNFKLGCTPIVNLFKKTAEPVHVSQQQNEYQIIPDIHRQMATEIYSIDTVQTNDPSQQITKEYFPFYSIRHNAQSKNSGETFWFAIRRPSQRKEDPGTEIYISLVDMAMDPNVPAAEALVVQTTCTNRDLPGKLPFGLREGDFELEGAKAMSRVRCLKKPTNTLRTSLRSSLHWRLISHLSLNYLSIVEGNEQGEPEALREILMLYDLMDSPATRKQIMGITKVSSRRVVRQTGSHIGTGLVRGMETTLEFDEEQYVGSGVFLLASVLEKFLGLYSSVNSFNQLVVRTRQREGVLYRWPPRAGEQTLL